MTKKPDDYDEIYMKIKFNLDDELLLNKNNKYYPQVFLGECL